jgi:hypothetical protein
VLDDCEKVAKLRKRNTKNQTNSRLKKKTVTGDTSQTVTEQIRLDKIREDKIIKENNNINIITKEKGIVLKDDLEDKFYEVYNKYPKHRRVGHYRCLTVFKDTVITDDDYVSIKKALDNYLLKIDHERIQPNYVLNASKWFEDWRSYVDYEPDHQINIPNTKENRSLMAAREFVEGDIDG